MALFTVLGVSYILLAGTVEKQSYMHTCISVVGNKNKRTHQHILCMYQ